MPRHPNALQLIVGLFSEVRIHIEGLKRMVEMRGGISAGSIRGSTTLAAILTYALLNPPPRITKLIKRLELM